MFGPVDKTRDHSIVTVSRPVKIMPLRRAVLRPGIYYLPGDVRGKLGHVSVLRLQQAGFFSVEFVKGLVNKIVSAPTQSSLTTQIADLNNRPDSSAAPPTDLPGITSQLPVIDVPADGGVGEETTEHTDEVPSKATSVGGRKRRTSKVKPIEAKKADQTEIVTPEPITPDAVEESPYEAVTATVNSPVVDTPPVTIESPVEKAPEVSDGEPADQSILPELVEGIPEVNEEVALNQTSSPKKPVVRRRVRNTSL